MIFFYTESGGKTIHIFPSLRPAKKYWSPFHSPPPPPPTYFERTNKHPDNKLKRKASKIYIKIKFFENSNSNYGQLSLLRTPSRPLLVYLIARARKNGDLFQSSICNLIFCCPYYRGFCNSAASARRELTVFSF